MKKHIKKLKYPIKNKGIIKNNIYLHRISIINLKLSDNEESYFNFCGDGFDGINHGYRCECTG
jgi:hypothetical protein